MMKRQKRTVKRRHGKRRRLSQTEWLEQIQKWKEKYNRITDKRIKELYKICRANEIR